MGGSQDNGNGGLNAPFGAQCFLTIASATVSAGKIPVLMHLLALSAF